MVPVRINNARKFKEILSKKSSYPTIGMEVNNNVISMTGIEQIKDPYFFIQENIYKESYHSINKLEKFIGKYPTSLLVENAKSRILSIKETKKIAKVEEENRARMKAEKERKLREAFTTKKRMGDKVCMDGTTAIILPITIIAFVENVNGDSIQLRIADTDGTSPHYNGVTLYNNIVIWDKHFNWRHCN